MTVAGIVMETIALDRAQKCDHRWVVARGDRDWDTCTKCAVQANAEGKYQLAEMRRRRFGVGTRQSSHTERVVALMVDRVRRGQPTLWSMRDQPLLDKLRARIERGYGSELVEAMRFVVYNVEPEVVVAHDPAGVVTVLEIE